MYKNRCYMPFILYPPDMYDIPGNPALENVVTSLDLHQNGTDFVMYLSIPYCRICCKACPYFVELLPAKKNQSDILDKYVDVLVSDLKKHASINRWSTAKLRGVYIGGGTGSLLDISSLDKILTVLGEEFNLAKDCEITLEGNAKDFDKEKAFFVAGSLINRISLGAQSFQPEVLKMIGAPHKAQQTIDMIRMLQDAGTQHISLDMMYNMPEHTIEHWEKDFKVLHELGIQHLTTYLYRVTPGTRQDMLIKEGKIAPVAHAESSMVKEMQAMIRQFAADAGMHNYMYEHYAKPGYESKYNQWTMKECVDALGIGPGAYSFINQRRTGISKDIDRYINAVTSGEDTFTTASIPLPLKMSRQRYIIFNLLYYKIEKDHYRKLWGSDCHSDFNNIINNLINDKLLIDSGRSFDVTEQGKHWLQNMMLEFFDESMWGNSLALEQQQSSWAMNNHMIDLGSSKKEFWLEKSSN